MPRVLFVFFSCSLSVGVLSLVTEIVGMFCGGLRSVLLARITVEMASCLRERRRQGFVGPCAVINTRSGGRGQRASLTPWSKTLPVIVGESVWSRIGMKETPREVRWLSVHTSQDRRKSTRNAATRKCLTIPFHLETMIMFYSTARAADVGPTQPLPDDWAHSEASPQGIACWSRHPRSAPRCNQPE